MTFSTLQTIAPACWSCINSFKDEASNPLFMHMLGSENLNEDLYAYFKV